MNTGEMKFKRKNNISCIGLPIKNVIWKYICWILAGKPDKWRCK